MSDDNIVKFERRNQAESQCRSAQCIAKALTWLAVIAGLFLVWAYYHFIAPAELTLKGSVHAPSGKLISRAAASGL
ncbi:hypothetical protein F2981_21790 (plasmid) [Sinorhizobium meliloti]|nr:hypothetical protein [Sinorhizobium meliloti]